MYSYSVIILLLSSVITSTTQLMFGWDGLNIEVIMLVMKVKQAEITEFKDHWELCICENTTEPV